jgi:hypothetical protein
MIHSLRAIVRYAIPEYPALAPGTLVRISDWAFDPRDQQRRFPATLQSQPAPLLWLAPNHLLPYSRFLRRQPRSEFWMLALKENLLGRDADQFLSDPIKETSGAKAFRFESLGEVVHYMRRQQLNAHKFKLCYVFDIALE